MKNEQVCLSLHSFLILYKQSLMSSKYQEYEQLNLTETAKSVGAFWDEQEVFKKSISNREGHPQFTFYEGPPSANGLPGIHHVMARAIKDIFCRYKTLKGFKVDRKGGWDTHGLPVELGVEKSLGITKEDIGKKISVEDYNKACREEVMKYKNIWDDLTRKMGYWVDLEHPYITFDNTYIESVWHLLKRLHEKSLLYKGYTIQPYSWAAGTGLSSHELNQPGSYKMIKDTTITAQFKVVCDDASRWLFEDEKEAVFFLAWTTTPWTLPSNTALAISEKISYVKIKTFNPYTFSPVSVILASDLVSKYFAEASKEVSFEAYLGGDKQIPWSVLSEFSGKQLAGLRYEQLMPYVQPENGDAFRVIVGDFVTTEDGTGIVHIAPSFGADDFRVAKQNGIGSLTLVNRQGVFVDEVVDFAGMHVKTSKDQQPDRKSTDVLIAIKLKEENKAFRVEKYEHTYPHCWRTDEPVIFYPLDSWFIKTTAVKEKMIALNKTINWKPESTGSGRFGNWLENLVDWNLSRSRFWGIPLPVWVTDDYAEITCIGSVEELKKEIDKSIAAGLMAKNPIPENYQSDYTLFDLHKPYVDDIVLLSASGKSMKREPDLIDVWFDSGAMPYAQWHFPFENLEEFGKSFPADFIAEGVDQTRGWFFTLHAISTMLFDSVAYKNVVSNGLVLDKNGNKMSKRLGNAVDPFVTLNQYGPDATRWYMISNAQPWDNLKFNEDGITEVQRKFFGTLYNTYSFFVLYANIDGFCYQENDIPYIERPEIDRWILSELHSLIRKTDMLYADYEPTQASRAIQEFVTENLSNWYVRLSRRRFWKGDYSSDKISAYQTLYTCLSIVAKLMSPVAPFFADQLYRDLNKVSNHESFESVHLSDFPVFDESKIDLKLQERMELAQKISSMVLALRKKVNIKVRQPLNRILIPLADKSVIENIELVKSLILAEVNLKNIEFISDTSGIVIKKVKPNFKILGQKLGGMMKQAAALISNLQAADISELESVGTLHLKLDAENGFDLMLEEVEVISEDIPGWLAISEGKLTVALDIQITDALREEGIARELINKIQNIRKDNKFEVTDKIQMKIQSHPLINAAISNNLRYICSETLAESLEMVNAMEAGEGVLVEIDEEINTLININKFTNGK